VVYAEAGATLHSQLAVARLSAAAGYPMLEARPTANVRIRLMGNAVLSAGDSGDIRIASQKGLALVAYLAMNAGRPVERVVLADLLWGDRPEALARQNLRQAILTLRRGLGPYHSALYVDDQSAALAVKPDNVDAIYFAACATSAVDAQRESCLELPWAPFLDRLEVGAEPFDEWARAERHRLETIATRVFSDLAGRFEAAGDGERAIRALERLIVIDPIAEERHRRLLALEARYRGADAALARARGLVAQLKSDVGEEPDAATAALIEQIRCESLKPSCSVSLPQSTAANSKPAGSDMAASPGIEARATLRTGPDGLQSRNRLLRLPSRLQAAGLLAALAFILAGGLLLWAFPWRPPAVIAPDTPQVAISHPWASPPLPSRRVENGATPGWDIIPILVMPFDTYDATESGQLLAGMLTDDLVNILSRNKSFRVISRQTARSYRSQNIDVAAEMEKIGVRYVLEGSVRLHDGTLRVTVELTNTTSRAVVWSGRVERDQARRHEVLDEIVMRLARELHMESFTIESRRLSNDATADALAYRGMVALFSAISSVNLEMYQKAEALFIQVLEREPNHLMARLGLGAYHVNVAAQRLVPDFGRHVNVAHELISGVLKDRPNMGGAHHQMGIILQTSGKPAEAIASFERALENNPSLAGAHAHIGYALTRMERPAEGIEHIRYAMRLSPKDPSIAIWTEFAGIAELELGHFHEAIRWFRRSIAQAPAYPRPWAGLAAAQALAGQLEDARDSAGRLMRLAPANLTVEELYRRFGRTGVQLPRFREGLRLSLDLPADH